jgi:uncharacterized protein YcfL
MKQILQLSHLWIPALLFAAGCSNLNDRPVTTLATTQMGTISRGEDPYTLIRKLEIRNAVSSRNSGLLQAQVEVFNKRKSPLEFRYKFVWIQDNGFTDETSSTWKTQRIDSQDTLPLSEISPNPSAVDFRVTLKPLE